MRIRAFQGLRPQPDLAAQVASLPYDVVNTAEAKALAEGNINIVMITTSEIKISVVIEERYMELAVRTLHEAFGLDKP